MKFIAIFLSSSRSPFAVHSLFSIRRECGNDYYEDDDDDDELTVLPHAHITRVHLAQPKQWKSFQFSIVRNPSVWNGSFTHTNSVN